MKPARLWLLPTLLGSALAVSPLFAGIPDQPHPGYDLKTIPLSVEPLVMGLGFLSDGRMVMATGLVFDNPTTPSTKSEVYLISGVEGKDLNAVKIKTIASNFISIAGVTIVNDKIYVSDQDGLYELIDKNNDDTIDERKKITSWPNGVEFHHWSFTPVYKDGKFYTSLSATIKPGGPSTQAAKDKERGTMMAVSMDGKREIFAGGLRAPNGVGMSPKGDILVTDNQGSWRPASMIMHMRQGRAYGHFHNPPSEPDKWKLMQPVAWLPHKEISASPSEPIYVHKGPYAGHWFFGDVNHAGLKRLFVEEVDGELQGCVFPFSKGIGINAVNRLVWGKDDALYIGSAGKVAGNWPNGRSPMYKLLPNGKSTFEMLAIRSRKNGMEIEFTEAVDKSGQSAWKFDISQWHYTPNKDYGGGKKDIASHSPKAVTVSPDGKRVFLEIDGLKPLKVTYFKIAGIKSQVGAKSPWNDEAWYTLNAISPTSAFSTSSTAMLASQEAHSSKLAKGIRARIAGAGRIAVTVNVRGDYSIALKAVDGTTLDVRQGHGAQTLSFAKPGATPGMYILQITQGRAAASKMVVF